MKKIGISLALCLFLTGCGGGSSESSPSPTPTPTPPPPPPNSAPTLTGSLLLSVPANVSGSLVVDVVDVDGDTITASTTDQDWVSLEVSSGQLTITATPTVFELGENAFDLVLSDGTDSSTYELTINVQDNPTSYSYIDIEQDTLRGNWQLSDGQKVFFGADRGFLASESAEIFPFSSYFYNGRLRAETKPMSCMNCDTLEDLEILLAAEHSDGRIALRLDSDNVGERTLIAAPIESTVLTAPAYALMNRAGGDTFQVEPLKPTVELLFQERITIGSSIFSGSRRYDVGANITANGSIALSTPAPAESTRTFTLDLPVYTSAGYVEQDNVEFRTLLSDLTITDVADGVVAISGNVQLQLVDEDSLAYPINEYDDLVGALATQIPVVAIYSELQPIDYPEFEEGDKYLFNLAHESEAFSEFRRFGSLTFTGSETADIEIDILDPMAMRQQTFAVTYSVDGNTMSIVFAGKTYEHQLYTNIFGQRVTVSEYSFDDSTVITNYPFAKKESIELTQATLLGHWQGQTFNNTFDGTPEILWFADEMFMERVFNVDYFNQADDFYRLNEDNTVSILRRYQCLTATNYAECEQQVLEDLISNDFVTIYNEKFEFFHISADELVLTRTIWVRITGDDAPIIGTFNRIFKKIDGSQFD